MQKRQTDAVNRVRQEALAGLRDLRLDVAVKGIAPRALPMTLGEIGNRGWSLLTGDLTMPVATLRRSTLEANSRWMRAFIEKNGIAIAPHGKTTLAPQLFDLQERDGAWAITVSNVQQVALCRRFGFDRIIIANQVVGRSEIDYVVSEAARSPELELFCLVDSDEGVQRFAAAGKDASRIGLLIEVGVPGGRTGVRDLASALSLARAVRSAGLSLRGIEGFEGILATPTEVDAFLDRLAEVTAACRAERLFVPGQPIIVSAGGTAYYDRVAARLAPHQDAAIRIVTRSGCYLTHDSGGYDHAFRDIAARDQTHALPEGGPRAALNVWTYVQSRPEPGLAILAMGRRDVGFDAGLPTPLLWYREGTHERPIAIAGGHAVTALNDQHAYMTCPADSALAVGDIVGFGISHPCTTFDKWQVLFVIDDDYRVVDAIKTFF